MIDPSTLGAAIVFFILGTIIGSFLNVLSLRHGTKTSVVWTRSRCMSCHRVLGWWELLPIISFIVLRGRCQRCHHRISGQYPLVEVGMGIVSTILLLPTVTGGTTWFAAGVLLAVAACLLVLGIIDFYTFLLPDRYLGVLSGLVLVAVVPAVPIGVVQRLGGAAVGAGFLFLLWLLTRGNGIGLGDIKLMLPLGFFFGISGTLTVLFLAFFAGGLVGLYLLAQRQAGFKTAIPFGPFLTGAAIFILLYPALPTRLFSFIWG